MKHIVGFSGGIDSQACALWVRRRFPIDEIVLLNSPAGGNESPITVNHIQQYSQEVFPVTVVENLVSDMWETEGFAETKGLDGSAPLDFKEMIRIKKRPPSMKARFCTEKLKLVPQKRWIEANISGEFERYSGIRRDESDNRKDTPFRAWDGYYDTWLNCPLADWTKKMCFEYVQAAKEPLNPLYSLGFERVGCAPCVNSGKEDIRLWSQRFPDMIDKLRSWEQETGISFFPPCVPGAKHNKIDEVVSWAMTDYGGKQFNIFRNEERPSCESKFGLCE